MAKKLYVGGVAYATTNDSLKKAFEEVGTVVKAEILMDKITGRSRGFGFVEMSTDAEADAAISRWNGQDLEGRKLTVNEAKPQAPRAPRSGGFDNGDRGGRSW